MRKDPTKAVYAEDTHTHWKYTGKKATQYWYCSNPSNELEGVVNGRYTYWASKSRYLVVSLMRTLN